ncbi:DUF4124 domain-containing protein [Thiocapsa marina]|uniref:DUF4124 domain-containing protein n=1 Tax=Thiocapsa marina 5811 TaxID=768671 RepID=F9UCC4_9GAMM|nr:DUF4124 domain-containing protein [Thiocapsa marina]EGV18037.1 hypothetical protein ThimaDRAFT_2576 [Thiocapsa marina 5811]
MTKQLFVAAVLIGSQAASAEIFRWVDADGRTHFSDRRPPDAAVQRVLPDTGQAAPPEPGAVSAGDTPFPGPYTAFEILAPTSGDVLIQSTDSLEIDLRLEPDLFEGHQLEILLDDRPVPVESAATRFQIQGVGFEAHRIQARVQDALGTVVAATPSLELELRQSAPPGVLP